MKIEIGKIAVSEPHTNHHQTRVELLRADMEFFGLEQTPAYENLVQTTGYNPVVYFKAQAVLLEMIANDV